MSTAKPLDGNRILIFVGDEYEDLELWYPKLRLEEAGARCHARRAGGGELYRGKHGYPCVADAAISDMEAADFQGVICPGGWMPDKFAETPGPRSCVNVPRRQARGRDLSWWMDS